MKDTHIPAVKEEQFLSEKQFDLPPSPSPDYLDSISPEDARKASQEASAKLEEFLASLSPSDRRAATKQARHQSKEAWQSYLKSLPRIPALPTQDDLETISQQAVDSAKKTRAEFLAPFSEGKRKRILDIERRARSMTTRRDGNIPAVKQEPHTTENKFNLPPTPSPDYLDSISPEEARKASKEASVKLKEYLASLLPDERREASKQAQRQSKEAWQSYLESLPEIPALPTRDELKTIRQQALDTAKKSREAFLAPLSEGKRKRILDIERQQKFDRTLSSAGNSLKKYSMLVALVMIMLLFTILTRGRLLLPMNLSNLVFQNAYVVIMAVGMLLCILTGGNIDLSVGSVVGFIAGIAGWLMILKDFPVFPSILICLFAGILIGCWHGFWIAYIGIPSFITTLAGMLIFRGLTMFVLRGGETVNKFPTSFMILSTGHVPDLFPISPDFNLTCLLIGILAVAIFVFFRVFGRARKKAKGYKVGNALSFNIVNIVIGIAVIAFTTQLARYKGLPTVIFILMIIIVIYTILTSMTVPGRYLYALGGNPKAAKLSGIDTKKVMFLAYTNMAFLAAVAGLVFAARLDAAIPAGGTGFELDAIGSCFIGGASAYGGIGTVGGVLIGAIFMGVMNNGMNLFGIQTDVQQVVKGLVLLLAVAFDVVSKRKSR